MLKNLKFAPININIRIQMNKKFEYAFIFPSEIINHHFPRLQELGWNEKLCIATDADIV